jgi:hypothetical protein
MIWIGIVLFVIFWESTTASSRYKQLLGRLDNADEEIRDLKNAWEEKFPTQYED